MFPAKIFCTVDTRVQRWLIECRKVQDRNEVDERIIELRDIVNDVVNSRFYLSLPPLFTMINVDEKREGSQNTNKLGSGLNNKWKGPELEKDSEDKMRWINNTDWIAEFRIREGEDWKSTFCGKCAEARPTWKGKVKICKHTKSHVDANQISDEKKADYTTYLKKVRGE
eukprot:4278081-Ditylum_brightwellii.AAC.1